MNKPLNFEKSRWPTTIISTIVSVLSFYFAILNFQPTVLGVLISIAFVSFGVLAAITAYEGKPKASRWLFDSSLYLP